MRYSYIAIYSERTQNYFFCQPLGGWAESRTHQQYGNLMSGLLRVHWKNLVVSIFHQNVWRNQKPYFLSFGFLLFVTFVVSARFVHLLVSSDRKTSLPNDHLAGCFLRWQMCVKLMYVNLILPFAARLIMTNRVFLTSQYDIMCHEMLNKGILKFKYTV